MGKEYNEINEPERIVTVRLMDPREFGPADPAVRRGTHEVVLSDFEETSYIFRNDGNGWRIASIAGDGVTCVEVELVLWDYLWFCNRLIGLQH